MNQNLPNVCPVCGASEFEEVIKSHSWRNWGIAILIFFLAYAVLHVANSLIRSLIGNFTFSTFISMLLFYFILIYASSLSKQYWEKKKEIICSKCYRTIQSVPYEDPEKNVPTQVPSCPQCGSNDIDHRAGLNLLTYLLFIFWVFFYNMYADELFPQWSEKESDIVYYAVIAILIGITYMNGKKICLSCYHRWYWHPPEEQKH